jgi:hypothetical protein
MHKYERIGLWSLVILLLVIVLFKPRFSGYSPGNLSFNLMDAQEFRKIPNQIKTTYSSQFLRITDALGTKIANEWNRGTAAQKADFVKFMKNTTEDAVNKINSTNNLNQAIQSVSGPTYNESVGRPMTETRKSGYEIPNMFDYVKKSGYEIPNMFSIGQSQQREEEGYTSYFVQ